MTEVALLVNPVAGRGRAGRLVGPVIERLRAGGIVVRQVVGRDRADASALARAAVAAGVSAVVAVGGDGTVHAAIQAVADSPTPLGIIPAGTGNDIAAALDLPADQMAAVDIVLTAAVRAVDVVRCGPCWWAGVLGTGFDSAVNERANTLRWPRGPTPLRARHPGRAASVPATGLRPPPHSFTHAVVVVGT